jgi:hypothetical protein
MAGEPSIHHSDSFDRQSLAERGIQFHQYRAEDDGTRGHFKARGIPVRNFSIASSFLIPITE